MNSLTFILLLLALSLGLRTPKLQKLSIYLATPNGLGVSEIEGSDDNLDDIYVQVKAYWDQEDVSDYDTDIVCFAHDGTLKDGDSGFYISMRTEEIDGTQ